ncbi:MCE family protein [Amycolatopsis umgeniensis]|uniref:Phospholipid/cholesterol/gamma-HCH transport system substrate-binding protein n=1 Tax=Amycolatopsis umgeniensis TaxID=336628 RepID=A0A841B0S9_9PSEU|nr:MCE family protein [Amycolatopsis umgeniensis]MBB5852094.1 phospholipid/cholesterol/gamma-HCH transport system substrate-binding protein [Amycolatopsis umgeniensis]
MTAAARVLSLLIVATLFVAGAFLVLRPAPAYTVVAEFPQAEGIYPGSKVGVLGVPLGEVTAVEPLGGKVRVSLSLPEGVKVPADAQAWVMSPAVISDQYVELTPAYKSGPALPEGGVIPVGRAHSPVKWDSLMASLNTLLTTFGPEPGKTTAPLGELLDSAAKLLHGNGPAFKEAITHVAQASGLVAGELPDVATFLETLKTLVGALAKNKDTVDSVTNSVNLAAAEFGEQQDTIAATMSNLSVVLTDVAQLVKDSGASLTTTLPQLNAVVGDLAARGPQIAEILDTLPLGAQNLSKAVTGDDRLRVRLDVSTNLSQFAAGRKLCESFPIPLCSGAGLVNPVRFPPSVNDPLGFPVSVPPTGGK